MRTIAPRFTRACAAPLFGLGDYRGGQSDALNAKTTSGTGNRPSRRHRTAEVIEEAETAEIIGGMKSPPGVPGVVAVAIEKVIK